MIKLINYLKAGYSGIYLVSSEDVRVQNEVKQVAKELTVPLYAWSISNGLVSLDSDVEIADDGADPISILDTIIDSPQSRIIILQDYHSRQASRRHNNHSSLSESNTCGT